MPLPPMRLQVEKDLAITGSEQKIIIRILVNN